MGKDQLCSKENVGFRRRKQQKMRRAKQQSCTGKAEQRWPEEAEETTPLRENLRRSKGEQSKKDKASSIAATKQFDDYNTAQWRHINQYNSR